MATGKLTVDGTVVSEMGDLWGILGGKPSYYDQENSLWSRR